MKDELPSDNETLDEIDARMQAQNIDSLTDDEIEARYKQRSTELSQKLFGWKRFPVVNVGATANQPTARERRQNKERG
jgi:hypothetical protein